MERPTIKKVLADITPNKVEIVTDTFAYMKNDKYYIETRLNIVSFETEEKFIHFLKTIYNLKDK